MVPFVTNVAELGAILMPGQRFRVVKRELNKVLTGSAETYSSPDFVADIYLTITPVK